MIQANELRIWNNLHDFSGKIVQVTSLSKTGARCTFDRLDNRKQHTSLYDLSELHPIPLTPEILENCGFNSIELEGWWEFRPSKESQTLELFKPENEPFHYADGTKKVGWVIDLGGNIELFGKIETMRIETTEKGLYYISNIVGGQKKQLTNVPFQKAA